MKNVLGVILARGGSKGIPKKNIRPICGHPLIAYTICAALRSSHITDVVVSTDSEEIANIAIAYGATVPFLRSAELSGDKVPSVDAVHNAVVEAEGFFNKQYDYVVELPCVAPLRDHTHIDDAIDKMHKTGCDSVISVVNTGEKHPIRLKKIINDRIVDFCSEYPEPAVGSRRQDLEPASYIRNGAIYAMTRETIVDNYSRHGSDSRPYIMPSNKSINIDEPLDLEMAHFMISSGYCNNKPVKKKITYFDEKQSNLPLALVTTPTYFMGDAEKDLLGKFRCKFAPRADLDTISDLIRDVDVLICQPCPEYKIDDRVLRNAGNLKVIASTSTGTNHIDVSYCSENKVEVVSLRNSSEVKNIVASSEFTFGLVLSVMRQIPQSFENAKAGRWREDEDMFRGVELRGKTMGVIGYGRIGSNNARYARAFGMNVIAYDPNVIITNPDVVQASCSQDVIKNADVLLVCVHLDETTSGMVNDDWFENMKYGVYFINTSRGEVVDEDALLRHLKSGKVSAAGLDVISGEFTKDKNTHPIIEYARNNTNLVVTPHIAGLTYDSEIKALGIILDKISEKME